MADVCGIAKSLFLTVDEYCAKLDSGKESIEDSLEKNHPLLVFTENFLEQFSAANLRQKMAGLNDRSVKQLVAERRRLRRSSQRPEAQRLMFQLELLCGQAEEIRYSRSETDAEDFHLQYFPQFLDRIIDWLHEVGAGVEIRDAASDTSTNYNASVGL